MKKNFCIKVIFVFLFLSVLVIFGLIKYSDYLSYEKTSEIKCSFSDCHGLYETTNGDVFLCAKDCVKLINKNGSEKWSLDANFSEPIICHNKNILGISDIKTNTIYVYNQNGRLYSVKLDNQLLVFSINLSGYCSTISKSKDSVYSTDVYGTKGEKIFTHVNSEENIFPVNTAVSPDGSVVGINFADVNNSNLDSKIIFLYTKDEMRFIGMIA